MTKITRTFETERNTILSTIEYNAVESTPLGNVTVRDYFSIETPEPIAEELLADFNPKQWVIRESEKEVVDQDTGVVNTYTNKWLVSYKG